jgi:hypothetical protein
MSLCGWNGGGWWARDWEHHTPLGPIAASILAVIAWLVFILLYALFWSTKFNLFQNVVVTIVSLVIMVLFIGLVWAVWSMTFARPWRRREQPAAVG